MSFQESRNSRNTRRESDRDGDRIEDERKRGERQSEKSLNTVRGRGGGGEEKEKERESKYYLKKNSKTNVKKRLKSVIFLKWQGLGHVTRGRGLGIPFYFQ